MVALQLERSRSQLNIFGLDGDLVLRAATLWLNYKTALEVCERRPVDSVVWC